MTPAQSRRRENARSFRLTRKFWALVKNLRPARDRKYLAWLRTQACAVPDCRPSSYYDGVIEAAHVGAIRGLRQKCSDRDAIPLCAYHHRIGPHSHHVLGKGFWSFWELDRDSLIRDYNALFDGRDS